MRLAPASRALFRLPVALIGILSAGCAATNPLLAPDSGYPATWAALAHLGGDCSTINGTYDNAGVLNPSWKGASAAEEPIRLSDLLIRDRSTTRTSSPDKVTLTLIPRSAEKDGSTDGTLRIALGDNPVAQASHCAACISGALRYVPQSTGSQGIPFIAVGTETSELWLTRSADGSLIICLDETFMGFVTVVPFTSSRRGWAKFEPAGR